MGLNVVQVLAVGLGALLRAPADRELKINVEGSESATVRGLLPWMTRYGLDEVLLESGNRPERDTVIHTNSRKWHQIRSERLSTFGCSAVTLP